MSTDFTDFELFIEPDKVHPFVYEDERTVALHFDISAIQSRMRRDDPYRLDLDYTRTMMGFLLLQPAPRAILAIGLGGGSLPKYCYRHLPSSDITVVEINPHVIELRDAFFVPPDDDRFRVVCDDGARFVARDQARYDVILVDGFTYDGQPAQLGTFAFYKKCRAALTEGGVMVVNLHEEGPDCEVLCDRISRTFGAAVVKIPADRGSNRIVVAARAPTLLAEPAMLHRRWKALPAVHQQTLGRSYLRFVSALNPSEADAQVEL